MKLNVITIVLVLFAGATFAALGECDMGSSTTTLLAANDWYQMEEYQKAGDCYRASSEWGKCVLSYLKAGHISEGEWDLNKGPPSAGAVARTMYDTTCCNSFGVGSYMGMCMKGYGDTTLDVDVTAYKKWMDGYLLNGGNPPFDMDATIATLEAKVFPPAVSEEPAVVEETPAPATAPVVQPTTTTAPPEEPAGDMTMIIIAAVIILVLAVLVGAAFLMKKKKPEHTHHHTHK